MKANYGTMHGRQIAGTQQISQLVPNAISHPDNVLHYKTCVNMSRLNTESDTCDAYKIISGRKIQTTPKNWEILFALTKSSSLTHYLFINLLLKHTLGHFFSLLGQKSAMHVFFFSKKDFFKAPFHAKFSLLIFSNGDVCPNPVN